jgi:hypothetical protein
VAAYLLVLAIVALSLLCRLWPPSEQLKEEEAPVRILVGQVSVRRETHILLIVLTSAFALCCAQTMRSSGEKSTARPC